MNNSLLYRKLITWALGVLVFSVFYTFESIAQVKIATPSSLSASPIPDASAMLEVESPTRGVLVPRMDNPGSISNPATGLIVYDNLKKCLSMNIGTPGNPNWQCYWLTGGNINTNPSTGNIPTPPGSTSSTGTAIPLGNNWLGTFDYKDFIIGTNNRERIRVSKDGFVSINSPIATPTGGQVISPRLSIVNDNVGIGGTNNEPQGADDVAIISYNNGIGPAPAFLMRSSRGTLTAPANLAADDILGSFSVFGQTASSMNPLGRIYWEYSGNGTTLESRSAWQVSGNSKGIFIAEDGSVSIADGPPAEPFPARLYIASTSARTLNQGTKFGPDPGAGIAVGPSSTTLNVAIHANGNIVATQALYANVAFQTTSDERVKNVISQSNANNDLDLLKQIQITNYTYKDKDLYGSDVHKKVIAQQIERVLPTAVKKSKGFLPDIYSLSTLIEKQQPNSQVITLDKPHNLKTDDKIELILQDGTVLYQRAERIDDKRFAVNTTTDFKGKVFVYGKEHEDVRSVDYDAISMLNVSATQALATEVEELKKQVSSLSSQNQILKQQAIETASLRSELEALKAVVYAKPGPPNRARPVAVKAIRKTTFHSVAPAAD
ncbi:tail fiber domain-containing protein [Spirosoma gilvum]